MAMASAMADKQHGAAVAAREFRPDGRGPAPRKNPNAALPSRASCQYPARRPQHAFERRTERKVSRDARERASSLVLLRSSRANESPASRADGVRNQDVQRSPRRRAAAPRPLPPHQPEAKTGQHAKPSAEIARRIAGGIQRRSRDRATQTPRSAPVPRHVGKAEIALSPSRGAAATPLGMMPDRQAERPEGKPGHHSANRGNSEAERWVDASAKSPQNPTSAKYARPGSGPPATASPPRCPALRGPGPAPVPGPFAPVEQAQNETADRSSAGQRPRTGPNSSDMSRAGGCSYGARPRSESTRGTRSGVAGADGKARRIS